MTRAKPVQSMEDIEILRRHLDGQKSIGSEGWALGLMQAAADTIHFLVNRANTQQQRAEQAEATVAALRQENEFWHHAEDEIKALHEQVAALRSALEKLQRYARIVATNNGWGERHAVNLAEEVLATSEAALAASSPQQDREEPKG